jgi:hypothetical protein
VGTTIVAVAVVIEVKISNKRSAALTRNLFSPPFVFSDRK